MSFLGTGLISIALIAFAVVVLNMEVGTDTVVQAYYTHEPLRYEETFRREGTAKKWQLGWPLRVTVPQVQYGLKNVDSVEGEFLVSVSFDNGSDRRNKKRRVILAPGQEETFVVNSPLFRTAVFQCRHHAVVQACREVERG